MTNDAWPTAVSADKLITLRAKGPNAACDHVERARSACSPSSREASETATTRLARVR